MNHEILLPGIENITPSSRLLKEAVADSPWAVDLFRELYLHSQWTAEHSGRTAYLIGKMLQELGIGREHVLLTVRAALLHDIGKLQISQQILNATGVNEAGKAALDEHPRMGFDLISLDDLPAAQIMVAHHEFVRGYPREKVREGYEDLVFFQKLLALSDATDALMSSRPYKPAWDKKRTSEELVESFDEEKVALAIEIRAGMKN